MSFILIILAKSLKCWGPKVEWVGYLPTFPVNQFDLVECNVGLQTCEGGCKHCVSVTGTFIAKSCAGDNDPGLKLLGIEEEGCKNITKAQNINYTKWINHSIGKHPNITIVADFEKACMCSSDGCNGPSEDNVLDQETTTHFIEGSGGTSSVHNMSVLDTLVIICFVITIIFMNYC